MGKADAANISGEAPGEITFSFVIPVQNEQEELEHFLGRLKIVADELGEPYEILLVNDGSTDDTASVIRRLAETDKHVRCVELSRSFGRQVALLAGHDFACGKAVISLEATGRHRPEFIPELVSRWREGFEVVYTQRRQVAAGAAPGAGAGGSWLSRTGERLARRLVRTATGVNLLDREDFRLLDRRAVQALRLHREAGPLAAILAHTVGFRQVGVNYAPEPPPAAGGGTAAAGAARAAGPGRWAPAAAVADVLFRSRLPVRLPAVAGGVLLAATAVYTVVALVLWPCGAAPPGWLSILAAVVALFGLQFLMLGVLGEYLAGILDQARGRPRYIVRDTLGWPVPEAAAGKAAHLAPAKKEDEDDFVVYT
jgi:polyisoprenyl-phosphate glycosyltransferase